MQHQYVQVTLAEAGFNFRTLFGCRGRDPLNIAVEMLSAAEQAARPMHCSLLAAIIGAEGP